MGDSDLTQQNQMPPGAGLNQKMPKSSHQSIVKASGLTSTTSATTISTPEVSVATKSRPQATALTIKNHQSYKNESSQLQQQQQAPKQSSRLANHDRSSTSTTNNSNPLTENDSSSDELDLETREKLLNNDLRSHTNRGFHDGYDEAKTDKLQEAFDVGYKKAFEQNFVLSTLKGVAQALILDKINFKITITNLAILESMNFDNPDEIESIKENLIRICRENRLEILAHYVSQMG